MLHHHTATQQQAGLDVSMGALQSPKGEGRKPTQPSQRKRSGTSHCAPTLPTAEQPSEDASPPDVMACFMVEITRPVHPETWPELKQLLWSVANAVSAGQRAVVAELIAVDVRDDVDAASSTHAYRVLCNDLQQRRARAAALVARGKATARDELEAGLYLHTGAVVNLASKTAADAFLKWRKDRSRRGPPWYKSPGIPINGVGFSFTQSQMGVTCKLSLLGKDADGHNQPPVVVGVAACGGHSWSTLRKVLDGELDARSARIVYDEHNRRWQLKVSYRLPVEQHPQTGHIMVLRRGLHRFLPMLVDDGTIPAPCDTGQSVIAFKRGLDARKAQLRARLPHQGRGARGHGKRRFYRSYQRLGDCETNFVKTWCQQQAAHVAKMALRHGCSVVVSEDFGTSQPPTHPDAFMQKLLRRFPFATLTEAVRFSLSKVGIELVEQPSDHNCQRCPKCGNEDPAQHDRAKMWFTCASCGTSGPSDLISCWNTLRDYGATDDAVEALTAKAAAMVKGLERRKRNGQAEAQQDDSERDRGSGTPAAQRGRRKRNRVHRVSDGGRVTQ